MERKEFTYVPIEQYTKLRQENSKLRKQLQIRKKHFADYIVFIALFAVALYTAISFILQFRIGIEPSPTLTTCFYSFFGVELASLAAIKYGKTKHGNVNKTETQEVNINEHQE